MTRRFADDSKLRVHFGRGQRAIADGSKMGAMLDRARNYGQLRPHGVPWNARLDDEHHITPRKKYPSAPQPIVAKGVIVRSGLEVTAQPIRESKPEPSHEMTDATHERLLEHGAVSKRLTLMEQAVDGPLHVDTLATYYGLVGDEYAAAVTDKKGVVSHEGVSRMVALYPLTFEGRELLRMLGDEREKQRAKAAAAGEPTAELSLTRMQALRSAVWFPSSDEVKERIARCDRQAVELLDAAQNAWLATGTETSRRTA